MITIHSFGEMDRKRIFLSAVCTKMHQNVSLKCYSWLFYTDWIRVSVFVGNLNSLVQMTGKTTLCNCMDQTFREWFCYGFCFLHLTVQFLLPIFLFQFLDIFDRPLYIFWLHCKQSELLRKLGNLTFVVFFTLGPISSHITHQCLSP